MKTSYIIGIIVVVIVVIGALFFINEKTATSPTATSTPTLAAPAATSTSTSVATSTPATAASVTATPVSTTAAPAPESFTVNGNDSSADVTTITVKKGTPVTITFGADANGTYHGGLDFRSSVVNSGTIAPGSTKTVSFTAEQSFVFQPYWPATNIAKPYHISIVVD